MSVCRVRTSIHSHEEFGPALQSMKDFFARLKANPPGGVPPKDAQPPPAENNAPGQMMPSKKPRKTPPREGT